MAGMEPYSSGNTLMEAIEGTLEDWMPNSLVRRLRMRRFTTIESLASIQDAEIISIRRELHKEELEFFHMEFIPFLNAVKHLKDDRTSKEDDSIIPPSLPPCCSHTLIALIQDQITSIEMITNLLEQSRIGFDHSANKDISEGARKRLMKSKANHMENIRFLTCQLELQGKRPCGNDLVHCMDDEARSNKKMHVYVVHFNGDGEENGEECFPADPQQQLPLKKLHTHPKRCYSF